MPSNSELEDIYSMITVCNKRCQGIQNEPTTGIMGRSFYCPFDVSGISLLPSQQKPRHLRSAGKSDLRSPDMVESCQVGARLPCLFWLSCKMILRPQRGGTL